MIDLKNIRISVDGKEIEPLERGPACTACGGHYWFRIPKDFRITVCPTCEEMLKAGLSLFMPQQEEKNMTKKKKKSSRKRMANRLGKRGKL